MLLTGIIYIAIVGYDLKNATKNVQSSWKQNLVLEPLEFAFNWNIKQVQGCISLKYARKFETFRHAYPF